MPSSFKPSNHSLQLWFSRVGDESKAVEQATEKQLSPSERKRLQSTKSINKRREFLLSRALIRHALQRHFPNQNNEWEFIEHQNNFPEIKNLSDNTFLSLSHSNGLICFAIANSPVGIDLEAKKQRDFIELAKVFMNKEELAHLSRSTNNQRKIFYRNWCIKEAYYKALPLLEQSSADLKNIPISDLLDQNKDWFVLDWEIEQFLLTVVIEKEPEKICHHRFLTSFSFTGSNKA